MFLSTETRVSVFPVVLYDWSDAIPSQNFFDTISMRIRVFVSSTVPTFDLGQQKPIIRLFQ